MTSAVRDPNTFSNYNLWKTTNTVVNLGIDFDEKRLSGDVLLRLKSLSNAESRSIVLDSSYLDVLSLEVDGNKPVAFSVSDRIEPYGSAVNIQLEKGVPLGASVEVHIGVRTTPKCTALQWMTPAQTSNKKHPYMFSQCQAIHARSLFPCQDTPDVKSTFDFNIRSCLPVIASGIPSGTHDFEPGVNGKPGSLRYSFKQENPIPSYLFAIASGDIATATIGPRSIVATGPEELSDSKWELEDDMENFLQAGEKVVFPYAWTTYNVLVLPPSFPYGGMENPNYTFATPTIISHDRENIDVIAHELSHSWSGNLVSNASWEHFWLNEGWTTYLERRIQAEIHGEPFRDFSAIIGWKALEDSVTLFGKEHDFTKMVIDLKDKDPDDAFSSIPYEKGFVFLYYLEKLVGKAKWDKFIPHYFHKYARKSLDSYEFKETVQEFFDNDTDAKLKVAGVDWDAWFFAPGLPPKPDFDTSLVDACYSLADKWYARSHPDSPFASKAPSFEPSPDDIKDFRANQTVVFLEKLHSMPEPLKAEEAKLMGSVYGFAKSRNVEVAERYFVVGLRAGYEGVKQAVVGLLATVGRMKFVRPLYRALNALDRDLAVATFEKNKGFYHPICKGMVEKDLFGKDT